MLLLATDSLYKARQIKACVKKAYSAENLLFSILGLGLSILGAKIAVTTITMLDS